MSRQRNKDKGRCPLGKVYFPNKRDAEHAAGEGGHAERCGRCRGWHPEQGRRRGRQK